ncbi:MAG TPA: O-antigen ligase family protein [Solirubrobacteraceae bacterium]|nr:O-antigen ligase family protein [Solirubrobacteraceae bacterium]
MSPAPLAGSLPSAGTLAVLVAAGLVLAGVLAVLMRRHTEAFPLLAILALPFRVPISADGRTVNLLVPLYVVVAAGTFAHLMPRLLAARDAGGATARGVRAADVRGNPAVKWVGWALLASVALYTLQISYSADRAKAAENLLFFYVPFGLLFVLMREVRWTPQLIRRSVLVLVAVAVVLAGVGFVEYYRKSLFLNPKLVAANQYDNYFRVNSVFFDPSIYGRFLMLVMLAVTTVVLWGTRRQVQIGAAVLAWLLAGLVTSFSQSSIAGLLLGLAVLAAYRWGARRTAIVTGLLVVLAAAVLLLAPKGWHLKGSSASSATQGRTSLIEGGLELFEDRPLQGFGSGSFETEYKRHTSASQATTQNAVSASHTIPITIAAEQGLVGLAVYGALLVIAFLALFTGAGRSPPRIAIAACFAALVLHTWTYADFLEDPFTWTLLAIGVALARAGGPLSAAGTGSTPAPGRGARTVPASQAQDAGAAEQGPPAAVRGAQKQL